MSKKIRIENQINDIINRHKAYYEEDLMKNAEIIKNKTKTNKGDKLVWAIRDCNNSIFLLNDIKKKKNNYELFCFYAINKGSAFYVIDTKSKKISKLYNAHQLIGSN